MRDYSNNINIKNIRYHVSTKNYCDKIHEYIRLYGEDYIWHIGWQIEPIPSKQDYRRDHKQETKEHKVFKGDPKRLEQIGQKCFDARQECFNEIGKRPHIVWNP